MNEMVERVMTAIAENQHQAWLYDERTCAPCDPEKLTVRRDWLRKAARAAIEAMPPMQDLLATTVSCSGLEITIQCNDHDVKDRLMDFLTGDYAALKETTPA